MSRALQFARRVRDYVSRRITPSLTTLSISTAEFESKKQSLLLSTGYVYGATVEGDIVEFGTMTGRTAVVLAQSMLACEREWTVSRKRLFLFDSFEGLPVAEGTVDQESPHVKAGIWGPGTCLVLTEQRLRELCLRVLPAGRFEIFAGWFSETVPTLSATERFALLHVDCDLCQSTLDALRPLFQRKQVTPGAMILFDDWNCNGGSPEFGERRAWRDLVEEFGIVWSDEGGYSWGGRRLIVHGYK